MTDSPAKYQAIPPSEDQAGRLDTRQGDVSRSHYRSTRGWRDTESRAKWTYFLLGCAILLPWNALVNGTPFFLSRLAGSLFYPTFSSYLASTYTLTNLLCQFYCTITSKQSSPSRRIFASTIAVTLLVVSLFCSTFIQGTPFPFYSFTLFTAAAFAVTSSYLYTSVFAGAALFGASFLQAVLSGQAAVAVAVSAVQVTGSIISVWGSSPRYDPSEEIVAKGRDSGNPEDMAARIFFGVSIIFLMITLVAYAWLTRQPFHKSVTDVLERYRDAGNADELTGLVADTHRNPLATEDNSRVCHVLKQNVVFMFSIAYVFAVTLAVYPAITVRVQSVNPGTHPLLFTAVHFLAFNTGDLVGRYSCSFPRLLVWSANKILTMSLLRTLFIPLLLLCNVSRPATTPPISPIINSDILYMVVLLALGCTNGFVATSATLAATSLEHNPRLEGRHEDVDVAAILCGFFVIVGLATGAISSFAVQAMI